MQESKDHSEQLKKYLSGEMSPREAHDFERMALDDPFLQEALEGAETIEAGRFIEDAAAIRKKLSEKKKPRIYWRVAAIGLLLMLGGWSTWLLTSTVGSEEISRLDESEAVSKKPETQMDSTNEAVEPIREIMVSEQLPDQVKDDEPNGKISKEREVEVVVDREPIAQEPIAEAFTTDRIMSDDHADEELIVEEFVEAEPPEAKRMKRAFVHMPTEELVKDQPSRSISGTVTDDFGEVLPGVSVMNEETEDMEVTDEEGFFSMDEVTDSTVLSFDTPGMLSQDVVVGGREEMNVKMEEDTDALQEVVVTGYGAYENIEDGYVDASPVPDYKSFRAYLEENLVYPKEALDQGIEGKVVLQLTLSPTGNISNIEVKRGLSTECDQEAIRLIQEGPRWNPATRDGKNIGSRIRVRVKFELD